MPGTFTFKPLEAKLTHDTDLIGTMNPYCSFSLGHNKFTGDVCQGGGKNPQWNSSIVLSTNSDEPTANLEVIDKEIYDILMMKDDLIGSCPIDLKEIESRGQLKRWYTLNFKNKPAGQILMEASFQADKFSSSTFSASSNMTTSNLKPTTSNFERKSPRGSLNKSALSGGVSASPSTNETFLEREQRLIETVPASLIKDQIIDNLEQGTHKTFVEQRQIVEPHTFVREVERTEMIPVAKQIEVTEPRKVKRVVQYTELVPVTKIYDIAEPVVVLKEIEVVEPMVVTKTIKVVEDVLVKKMVEVVEMVKEFKDVTVYEPRTMVKQVEVIEQVPVKKLVEVSEAHTVLKQVEFIEPVIMTQTIVKEILEPVVIAENTTLEVGPSTLLTEQKKVAIVMNQLEQIEETIDKVIQEDAKLIKQVYKNEKRTAEEEKALLKAKKNEEVIVDPIKHNF